MLVASLIMAGIVHEGRAFVSFFLVSGLEGLMTGAGMLPSPPWATKVDIRCGRSSHDIFGCVYGSAVATLLLVLTFVRSSLHSSRG